MTLFITRHTRRFIAVTAIAAQLLLSNRAFAQSADKVHLGVIYPVSTHGTHAPLDTNSFSFHLLAGVSAQEEGVAFAGLSNVVRNNITGVAFAGFSNHIGNRAEGVLFAGFSNTYKSAKGMQFAGFANISSSDVEGAQYAGFLNTAQNVLGAQFGGFANVAKDVTGPQFAGFINTAREIKGPQFAGFANIVSGDVVGPQLAGFVNVAKDVKGPQFAGFINVARKVRGAQIAGFINIADSSDCPIGIINIIKNGEKGISLSVDETQTTLLSFRSGGKKLYGIIGAGYNWKNEDNVFAFEAGLGAHLLNAGKFRLNTELSSVCLEDFERGEYFKSSFRLLPAITLGKTVELFGGPALHFVTTNTTEGEELSDHYFWTNRNKYNDYFNGFYFGYLAGLNIRF